jgi:hypothetical protein
MATRSGLIIGLGLALGLWGPTLYTWLTQPIQAQHAGLSLAGLAFVLVVCLATSWLTASWSRAALVMLAWAAAALALTVGVAQLPFAGRTWLTWLWQPMLAGQPLYGVEALSISMALAGFFLVVMLSVLGLLQGYRLDNLLLERGPTGRLSERGRVLLWLPLPVALALGLIAGNIYSGSLWLGVRSVAQVIDEGRAYVGDLFWYGQQRGLHYIAIEPFLAQMDGPYRLTLETQYPGFIGIDVDAHFDNGFWLRCRVTPRGDNRRYDYVASCLDAGQAYVGGLAALLRDESLTCRACKPTVSAEWRAWLATRFPQPPQVALAAAAANVAVVRLDSAESPTAVLCWLQGPPPVTLTTCRDM